MAGRMRLLIRNPVYPTEMLYLQGRRELVGRCPLTNTWVPTVKGVRWTWPKDNSVQQTVLSWPFLNVHNQSPKIVFLLKNTSILAHLNSYYLPPTLHDKGVYYFSFVYYWNGHFLKIAIVCWDLPSCLVLPSFVTSVPRVVLGGHFQLLLEIYT